MVKHMRGLLEYDEWSRRSLASEQEGIYQEYCQTCRLSLRLEKLLNEPYHKEGDSSQEISIEISRADRIARMQISRCR